MRARDRPSAGLRDWHCRSGPRRARPLAEREKGLIERFQIVAPTTWNFSPRDAQAFPARWNRLWSASRSARRAPKPPRSSTSCARSTPHGLHRALNHKTRSQLQARSQCSFPKINGIPFWKAASWPQAAGGRALRTAMGVLADLFRRAARASRSLPASRRGAERGTIVSGELVARFMASPSMLPANDAYSGERPHGRSKGHGPRPRRCGRRRTDLGLARGCGDAYPELPYFPILESGWRTGTVTANGVDYTRAIEYELDVVIWLRSSQTMAPGDRVLVSGPYVEADRLGIKSLGQQRARRGPASAPDRGAESRGRGSGSRASISDFPASGC